MNETRVYFEWLVKMQTRLVTEFSDRHVVIHGSDMTGFDSVDEARKFGDEKYGENGYRLVKGPFGYSKAIRFPKNIKSIRLIPQVEYED